MKKKHIVSLTLTAAQYKSLKMLACRQQVMITEAIGMSLNSHWRGLGKRRHAIFKEPAWLTEAYKV